MNERHVVVVVVVVLKGTVVISTSSPDIPRGNGVPVVRKHFLTHRATPSRLHRLAFDCPRRRRHCDRKGSTLCCVLPRFAICALKGRTTS